MFAWRAVFGAILVGGVAGIGLGVGDRSAGAAVTCTQQYCVWVTDYFNGGFTYNSTFYPNGSKGVYKSGTTDKEANSGKSQYRDQRALPDFWHNQNNGVYDKTVINVTEFAWTDYTPNCYKVNGNYPTPASGTHGGFLASSYGENVAQDKCKPEDVPGG